ncbi:MAG: DUF2071 domain-containing protein [Actinobacteria bacterium]|nr:DUF2071 domain-containing protein [Actinomycetota bacterium]
MARRGLAPRSPARCSVVPDTQAGGPAPEPVTAEAIRPVSRPLLTMQWRDVAFLHWPVDTGAVARLMPPGTRPDLFHGVSYAGVIALRMHDVGMPGLPAPPYLGSFPEINVRLYSVGPDGRRGVVFCSMDAARLLPVLIGRAAPRLPYRWSRMLIRRRGDVISYASHRRWPGPAARLRLAICVGGRLDQPSGLEQFVTARWGLHNTWYGGRARYLPNEHPPWLLYRATLLRLEEDLLTAAGLPPPAGDPVSVLYSPGVAVRMGAPGPASAEGH